MQQIFPREIFKNSQEVHHAKHNKRSQLMYFILVMALIFIFTALPFIKVKVHETARGIIRSEGERLVLKSNSQGIVLCHTLIHNQYVHKGDTLLVVKSQALNSKKENTEKQIKEILLFVDDLEGLLNKPVFVPQSSKYHQELLLYKERKYELNARLQKAKKDYDLEQQLFDKEVVSQLELEAKKLIYDVALSSKRQAEQQQFSMWEGQLAVYKEQLRDLQSSLSQVKENQTFSVLKAPRSGTLLDVVGVSVGSTLVAGTQLATLSPDTTLCVECYLSPSDIGLLQEGNSVKFQIDAFDYNQWGLAEGFITMISNDVQIFDNLPVFRVQCKLNQKALRLKNGFEGKLKKGMTLTARFEVAERSLFQLLYDKVDDWMNPNVMESSP